MSETHQSKLCHKTEYQLLAIHTNCHNLKIKIRFSVVDYCRNEGQDLSDKSRVLNRPLIGRPNFDIHIILGLFYFT